MIQSIGGMNTMARPQLNAAQGPPKPEELFAKLDTDGDEALSTDELQAMSDHMAEKMGDNAPSVDDIMAKLDSDGDGAVSFAEFEAGRPQGPPPGGPMGQLPQGMNVDEVGQPDLSELFQSTDQDEETRYEDLLTYA